MSAGRFGASNKQQGVSGKQNTPGATQIGLQGDKDKRTGLWAKVTCRRPAWLRFHKFLEAVVYVISLSMALVAARCGSFCASMRTEQGSLRCYYVS